MNEKDPILSFPCKPEISIGCCLNARASHDDSHHERIQAYIHMSYVYH